LTSQFLNCTQKNKLFSPLLYADFYVIPNRRTTVLDAKQELNTEMGKSNFKIIEHEILYHRWTQAQLF